MTTLTYQPEAQPEFTEDEMDSLRKGEEMQAAENAALAGKFQSAEELEKAYLELQSKFSQQQGEQGEEQPQEQQQDQVEESDLSFLDTLWNEAQNEYSEDTLEQLGNMDAADVAQMYLEYRNNIEEDGPVELSPENISNLYNVVGGQEEYTNMVRWASSELDPSEIELYDGVMNGGDPAACFFAVQALAFRYSETQGWQGSDFFTGKAATSQVESFRSQQEVVQAMSDPRYDVDPAYRQDVMAKLERSSNLMY